MRISRYQHIRSRLIDLHAQLSLQPYQIYLPRQFLYTLDELDEIERVSFDGGNYDKGELTRPQLHQFTVADLIDIIPNLDKPGRMGYKTPNRDSIIIYESVQEYISLWCEIISQCPEYSHPPLEELYGLEGVAKWAYYTYADAKAYVTYKEEKNQMAQTYRDPIVNVLMALSTGGKLGNGQQEESFISHLDLLMEKSAQLRQQHQWNIVDQQNFLSL